MLAPEPHPTDALHTGQVGYVITGLKDVKAARVGDTWHEARKPVQALPGFKPVQPMVYAGTAHCLCVVGSVVCGRACRVALTLPMAFHVLSLAVMTPTQLSMLLPAAAGLYPASGDQFEALAAALDRLTLNDASVTVKKESSDALGVGFSCGFLGPLHLEVFLQRLEQEYGASVISTAPTVPYELQVSGSAGGSHGVETIRIDSPTQYPRNRKVRHPGAARKCESISCIIGHSDASDFV